MLYKYKWILHVCNYLYTTIKCINYILRHCTGSAHRIIELRGFGIFI